MKKSALVLGAGGFIGKHMIERLKNEGYFVRGVDVQPSKYVANIADEFIIGDLRDAIVMSKALVFNSSERIHLFDEVYQFAADMGGAEYIFVGENDADIMHNSVITNLNLLNSQKELNRKYNTNRTKIFYSSSACIYPEENQLIPNNPNCAEHTAYPANPDSEYGWEKIFSERLYQTYSRNHQMPVRIARYHNIFGPNCTWQGGKEKVPAAICRKVASLPSEGGVIEVIGDGLQTRSFLYIDECIDATRKLMASDFPGPVNIGSEEMVSINQLVDIVAKVANKDVEKKHIVDGPTGVRGRNSDNELIRKKLGWDCKMSLEEGIERTYNWIAEQLLNQSVETY